MLYLTTRIRGDAFTAHRAFTEDRGPEGGLYIPMKAPAFSADEILKLGTSGFGDNVATVLNRLTPKKLDGWAVDFSIGRYPARVRELPSRIMVGEVWHNPDWSFPFVEENLARTVIEEEEEIFVSDWMKIATRIASIFSVYGELLHSGRISPDERLDISVACGDFSGPMAAYYARKWGLPLGNILICCEENSGLWALLHQGLLKPDALPAGAERLVFETLDAEVLLAFRNGKTCRLRDIDRKKLSRGLSAEVISNQRTEDMISAICRDSGYIADPDTARCCGGIIDCRARAGEAVKTLVLSENSPVHFSKIVSDSLGITPEELKRRLQNH